MTPATPPARGRPAASGLVAAGVLAVVALLALGCGGAWVYLRSRGTDLSSLLPAATTAPHASAPASAPPAPPDAPTPPEAPSTAPSASPTPSPTDAPPPSPRRPRVADAGASPSPRPAARMTGTNPRIVGGSFPAALGGSKAIKAEITRVMPAIKACLVATEFDPPEHSDPWFEVNVDPAGAVAGVRRLLEPKHPKFDACMGTALRQTRWPATPTGSALKLLFRTD